MGELLLRWGVVTRFPEFSLTAVRLPESFRGGCSFGVGA